MNNKDELMLKIGAITYTEAKEMAAEFTGYDEIISHLLAEGVFVIGKMTFGLRDGVVELSFSDGATLQHRLLGGEILRELCKRWSTEEVEE